MIKIDISRLAELVRRQPGATLKELRDRLGVVRAESTAYMARKPPGLSFKTKDNPLGGAGSPGRGRRTSPGSMRAG